MPMQFPVVCAAPLTEEVMNRFIEDNDTDEEAWNFVFVDSIDEYYNEPSFAPVKGSSNPDSPFIGKTPEECHQLLLKCCEDTESESLHWYFMIMDERSMQDDTVLLVRAGDDDTELSSVRATFETSASALVCYLTGHSSPNTDAYNAAETDGVYCGPDKWNYI
ncbi:hypothetical protein KCU73_g9626, partial [Aureobasidium melanogenum]